MVQQQGETHGVNSVDVVNVMNGDNEIVLMENDDGANGEIENGADDLVSDTIKNIATDEIICRL